MRRIMDGKSVASDKQVFELIRWRIENDVVRILNLVINDNKNRGLQNETPYYALARMMFPIAELMGSLIHRHKSTSCNLTLFLQKEFEEVRSGYKKVANTIVQVWRHRLIHTDEPPVLLASNGT